MSANVDLAAVLDDPLSVDEATMDALLRSSDDGKPFELKDDTGEGEDEGDAKEDGVQGGAPAAGEQKSSEKTDGDPAKAEEPAPIATRDGKGQIPFAVLQAERERARTEARQRQAAEQALQLERSQREASERQYREAQAELERLRQAAATGKPAGPQASEQTVDERRQLIEALREEAPDLAALLQKQEDELEALRATVAQSSQQTQRIALTEQQRMEQEAARIADEAIGNIPKLEFLRATDPARFDAVAEIDDFLRTKPEFKGMSLQDRFEKALAMHEAAHGPVQMTQQSASAAASPQAARAPSGVPAVKPARTAPHTLSDLPGGSLPPANDAEAVGSLSHVDLVTKMEGMTPEQVDALLARVSV